MDDFDFYLFIGEDIKRELFIYVVDLNECVIFLFMCLVLEILNLFWSFLEFRLCEYVILVVIVIIVIVRIWGVKF